ncbi:GTP cyclohydrolase II [Lactobacillus sp. ESL0684]|uniref:GTP cyclohydrolase II n=1 Tax=unclassified Lactobacillus TaxID=2620435 RepID=UPI0023FA034A|nr:MULTISPECIES: GTP cyclohydrolase II [unclassified Lactobacillus]WEV40040.1 GTP cyclohydrolase II [Lactobacillus sp. ESL0681]WEV43420.1 GTP cyclohydrolase II [Lactobacillus sp. ESL0684]
MTDQLNEKMRKILDHMRNGGLVIVADSPQRESEGDMIGLAEKATPEMVNTMITKARGLLCVPMSKEYADRQHISPIETGSNDEFGTAFTLSVDATTTTTGISAYDRAKTIKKLADPNSTWDDFYHPGHVFPLVAKEGGVLERTGHTEAALDLARLAGVAPVGFICECIKKDGTMARRKDLKALAEGMGLPYLTIEELIEYRKRQEDEDLKVESITKVDFPTKHGHFELEGFENEKQPEKEPTLLISKGDIKPDEPLLLRLHSECLTGDVFGSKRCDCGAQLAESLDKIEANGSGAVLYLRQEGRGIGLANKLRAYKLQDEGANTVEANQKLGFPVDARRYNLAAKILRQKGISEVRLMTNNPDKVAQLEAYGIKVVERVPMEVGLTKENEKYLATKKHQMNHILNEVD